MIYPPTNSIFYQLNPQADNLADYSSKVNPRLTDNEIQAIYNSLTIENGETVIHNHTMDGTVREIKYKDLIKEILTFANRLPTARLWLRLIPNDIILDITDRTDVKAQTADNYIQFARQQLEFPVAVLTPTFIHEAGHLIDRQNICSLSLYPYTPVNDGEAEYITHQTDMSEMEYMQMHLIDEAEKAALSAQLAFETNVDTLRQPTLYNPLIEKAFTKHLKTFKNQINPKINNQQEQDKENITRALYYASLEAQCAYMKRFLKPYTAYFKELPPAVYNECKMTMFGPIMDFKNIKKMNLSLNETIRTRDVISTMVDNLEYRELSYNILIHYLKDKYITVNKLQNKPFTKATRNIFTDEVLPVLSERKKLIPQPSDAFQKYAQAIEDRYMGFIRVKDLMPKLSPICNYLRKSADNPSQAIINIHLSLTIVRYLRDEILKTANRYFSPYYCQKVREDMDIEKIITERQQKERTR